MKRRKLERKACSKCGESKTIDCFYPDSRMTSGLSSRCKECTIEAAKKSHNSDPEKSLNRIAAWNKANPKRRQIYNKKWTENNPEKLASKRAKELQYDKKHPERCKERSAARRVISGKPLSKAYSKRTKIFYRNCPKDYHVDHIVPLCGKTVTGLHVPWNLQYLPKKENLLKGNRYWPDMH